MNNPLKDIRISRCILEGAGAGAERVGIFGAGKGGVRCTGAEGRQDFPIMRNKRFEMTTKPYSMEVF